MGSAQRFYGWYIVGVCVLVYFFTNGMTIFVPQNLFPRLMEDFAADAGQISTTITITFLATAVMAPFVGWLIDRFGVLRVIRSGLVFLAVCFCLYPFAATLQQLYLLHVGFAAGLVLCGLMPNVVLLSAWFIRYRGAVVGLLTSASSLAGGLLPLAIAPLVLNPDYGWRWGYGALALAFVLLGLLPGLLALKASPRELGQFPDGIERSASEVSAAANDGVEFGRAIRSATLWALAVSSACLWFSINSVNSQATIFFEQDAGLSPARATVLYSAIFWCSVAGKFLFGALSDLIPKYRVMAITATLLLGGCLLVFSAGSDGLQLARNINQLWLFAIVFGLGYGGSFTMIQLVCVECFGQRALGKLLGIIIFVDSLGGAAGAFVAGKLSAAARAGELDPLSVCTKLSAALPCEQISPGAGSYFVPFVAVTVVAIIAVISVLFIRPLQPETS